MKQTKTKKRTGILGKLVAGATAGATLGLATYLFLKSEKSETKKVENVVVSEDTKADLFV
ncbi:MAG: hypothetical protein ABJF11_06960 [Reichenbachiella sp.]|uniref:hypothetical protein n=1 Tax=Reichenbachiella sp. TaxID=2184521 RepID=UPI003263737D